ncbi:hypothetical protein [Paenibacillus montanisoli]|uniref:Uncharacterized protein n=1 Tax=Paenibacillus montanisoli TaxID=2081970 RepID=A0A328U220_9BACL|nr:hypothetical protein [Paenibacillus montanisoli]RAP76102.1 hypothetical protein DL346_11815 [Paenibacillus montanisoli]
MAKWISTFLLVIFGTVITFYGLAIVFSPSGDSGLLLMIGMVISIQCSLIITLLIKLIDALKKKR